MATRPSVASQGPPGPYWRLVAQEAAREGPAEEGRPAGEEDAVEVVIAGAGAVRDTLLTRLTEVGTPLAVFLGDPTEPFVATQVPWLRAILAQTGIRAVWLQSPGQTALPESPLQGPLLGMTTATQRKIDGLPAQAGLPPQPDTYYPILLWGLLGPFARPTMIGMDLWELPPALTGYRALLARTLTEGPDRTSAGVRALMAEVRAAVGQQATLRGLFFQVTAVPDWRIEEMDAVSKVMREELTEELPEGSEGDLAFRVAAPLGEYEGILQDKEPVSLVASFDEEPPK